MVVSCCAYLNNVSVTARSLDNFHYSSKHYSQTNVQVYHFEKISICNLNGHSGTDSHMCILMKNS